MAEPQLQQAEAKGEAKAAERLPESVPDFYRGRCVLVTGGSGFLGRVLLEKLLRCCPDLQTVYLLMRTRKGVLPHDRIKTLTDVPLFDRLRAERPGALEKVQVVAGDLALPGLGLSAADALMLCERVSIVFHSGASIRFDNPLKDAVRNNIRSTLDLLELATNMPLMKAFVHISTTFCNERQKVSEEKLYPTLVDWRTILKAVETLDPLELRVLTQKILGQHRNTYTFTKNMAEQVVNEYADRLPVGIMRPALVTSTWEDPIVGWVDNYNGPVGFLIGAGRGTVHTVYMGPDKRMDYIPCDMLVRGLIISSCEIARRGIGELAVYNAATCASGRSNQVVTMTEGMKVFQEYPYTKSIYYPTMVMTGNGFLFFILFLFLHLLPGVILDALLSAKGRKPILVRLHRRIFVASMAMSWFLTQTWEFENTQFMELEGKLLDKDRKAFALNLHYLNVHDLVRIEIIGSRRYLMHESDDSLPEARRRHKRNRLIHLALKTLFYYATMWIGLYILRSILWR